MKYSKTSTSSDGNSLLTKAVVSFHQKFSEEWDQVNPENRHKMILSKDAQITIEDEEVLTFVAFCLNCVLIIVKPCTNGLGYVIVNAFCSGDLDLTKAAYYILDAGSGHWFDALRAYGETEGAESESADDINSVVREFLALPRSAWNASERSPLSSSEYSTLSEYITPRGLILRVPLPSRGS